MNNTLTFRWFIKLVLMFLFCTMWHFLLPHTTYWPALCSYSLLLILNLKQTLESRLFIDSQSYQEKYGVETTDSTKYGQCIQCNVSFILNNYWLKYLIFLHCSKSCWMPRSGTNCSESCSRTCRTNVNLWPPSNTHCDKGQKNCTETRLLLHFLHHLFSVIYRGVY